MTVVWLQFLRQKYIQRLWIPAGVEINPGRRQSDDSHESRGDRAELSRGTSPIAK